MSFLVFLVNAFVNTFGITQPTRQGAERAARWLGVTLLLALSMVVALWFSLRSALRF